MRALLSSGSSSTVRLACRTVQEYWPPSCIHTRASAWGCGAFGGDAKVVAAAFREALDDGYSRAFARIVFAVMVRRWPDGENLAVFREAFASPA